MTFCKVRDKCLKLLNDKNDLYLGQSNQDNEQDEIMRKWVIHYTVCSELERMRIRMTEHQWKELSKFFLDNGNRKLSTEEKGTIKLAIDQADNLNELLQVAFASLAIDAHR